MDQLMNVPEENNQRVTLAESEFNPINRDTLGTILPDQYRLTI